MMHQSWIRIGNNADKDDLSGNDFTHYNLLDHTKDFWSADSLVGLLIGTGK